MIVEFMVQKRDSDAEIRHLIADYAADRLPAYQMAALAMAIFFRGLDDRETRTWTEAMLESGQVLDLTALGSGRVDKHSTGGVGDKISIGCKSSQITHRRREDRVVAGPSEVLGA